MFYGYDETTAGWQESKRGDLAVRLEILRKLYPEAISLGHPLVTNDEQGVLVRMVGRLSEEDQIKIVREADAILVEVMGAR